MYKKLSSKLGNTVSPRAIRLLVTLLACVAILFLISVIFAKRLVMAYAFYWNIFLAILPLPFAFLLVRRDKRGKHGPLSIVWSALWLVLFPNAPYMLTDFIHIQMYQFNSGYDTFPIGVSWLGLAHIYFSVAVGCLFGFLSLYLLQDLLQKKHGTLAGWGLCGAVSVLSGIGMYIGRFMRFNTWDIWHRPLQLVQELVGRLAWRTLGFCLLFSALTFGAYFLFYVCFDCKEIPKK